MFKTKITDKPQINSIQPRAVLADNYSLPRFIVELSDKEFAFMLPPDYEIERLVPQYMLESAITKYGYELIVEEIVLKNQEELSAYIKRYVSDTL